MFSLANGQENDSKVRFVEIGISVADTTRSIAFYTKILGMKRVGDWHASKEMATSAGVNSGKAFDIVMLNLDCDGYVLNYKLNQTQNNTDKSFGTPPQYYGFEKQGERYLTFNVKNVDLFIERIKRNNIDYKLATLPNEVRVVMLHDPDGALIEILGK